MPKKTIKETTKPVKKVKEAEKEVKVVQEIQEIQEQPQEQPQEPIKEVAEAIKELNQLSIVHQAEEIAQEFISQLPGTHVDKQAIKPILVSLVKRLFPIIP